MNLDIYNAHAIHLLRSHAPKFQFLWNSFQDMGIDKCNHIFSVTIMVWMKESYKVCVLYYCEGKGLFSTLETNLMLFIVI